MKKWMISLAAAWCATLPTQSLWAAAADRPLAQSLAVQLDQWQPQQATAHFKQPLARLVKRQKLNGTVRALAGQRDAQTISQRGLTGRVSGLMQVRLAVPAMQQYWQQGITPWVAYIPDGDEKQWSSIEAFDKEGNSHFLDVHTVPKRPIFVVAQDERKAQAAGLQLVREKLQQAGLSPSPKVRNKITVQDDALSTSILERVRADDVQEPWVLGDAEVFAIVTGVSPDSDEANVDIVDMPYLDEEDHTYQPHQIMVYWDRYRWGAADVLFYEQDDDYSYQELASLLIEVLGQGLSAGGVPEALPFAQLGQQIIDAMPASWFTNDDDYLDAFYTLEQGQSYQDYPGASGNIVITLIPHSISATE